MYEDIYFFNFFFCNLLSDTKSRSPTNLIVKQNQIVSLAHFYDKDTEKSFRTFVYFV